MKHNILDDATLRKIIFLHSGMKNRVAPQNKQRNQSAVMISKEPPSIIPKLLFIQLHIYTTVQSEDRREISPNPSHHNATGSGSLPHQSRKVVQSPKKKLSLRTKDATYRNTEWSKCGKH